MLNLFMQAAPAKSGGFGDPLLLIMVSIFLIFYFLVIRPQNKRLKDHKAKLSAVVRGDQVITSGGLVGKVIKVTDEFLTVDLGNNMKVKVVKSMLSDVVDKTVAANDSGKDKKK
ncbi:MAG: preprotein translocase subunit YajC [Robiginitomaculum sp.]|nr:preprotein translocase subunit YajC [Robiginitomaculum sp.]